MKNKVPFILCAIFSFTAIFLAQEKSREEIKPKHRRSPASVARLPHPQVKNKIDLKQIDAARLPVADGQRGSTIRNVNFAKPERPQNVPVDSDPTIYRGLNGLSVASALRALKAKDFSPEMGDIVKEEAGMVYFKPANGRSDDSWSQVAYDKSNNRFYPISSILRVEGISLERRDDLLSSGFQEHYYSAPTRLFYVRSSQQNLWTDYKALAALNLNVSVEVSRSSHRTR